MTSAVSRSISSPSARRVHYQSQISNASLSLSQSFSLIEPSNMSDSFSSSFTCSNLLVTIIYSSTSSSKDNQQILLNSYASCRRLLDHLKPMIGVQQDETIDLIDNDGKLKELNTHYEEYASQYLTARNTYYVLKVEVETTGEKRYIANFNIDQMDSKLHSTLSNALNTLNKSKKKVTPSTSKLNSTAQLTSGTTQMKLKKTQNRK